MKYFLRIISVMVLAVTLIARAAPAFAQSQSAGTLRGQVTDPSGAVVAGATVAILTSGGPTHSATTSKTGNYEIGNLPSGKYTVTANAKGFAAFIQNDVNVAAGQVAQFNIALDINIQQEKVNVQAEGPTLDVNPANNANAVILTGKDLEALPDDPDELLADLQALAGPSAGPNGGQIYIDGFTAGELPPKSSIREIRINQNPFSAEYDKPGFGRIEIFTKPGTDKFHGQFSVEGNSSGLNTRNPFLAADETQPYDSVIYMGNIGGPINKKSSFFFNVQRRNIDEVAVVNIPETLNLSESVPNPHTRTNIGPRVDYQLTPNNSITARYQFYRDTQTNAGVGGTTLPEAGYDTNSTEHTLQISDTQTIGTKAINETRFQYLHDSSGQNPVNTPFQTFPTGFTTNASINVIGDFTAGRTASGTQSDHQDHYELQNYTSISQGKHFVKFGGRLRVAREENTSNAGFNGVFTFADYASYENAINSPATATPSQLRLNAAPGGIVPNVSATVADAGLYVQDDWKVRPTFTLSGGLRFETQNAIHDHGDLAPRLGFAWGLGGGGKTAPKTVLRGGFGLFYDRFTQDLVLNSNRLDGVTEQQYIASSSQGCFPNPDASTCALTLGPSSVYRIGPNLHAPYMIQSALTMERQVTKIANATVTYLNTRGVHQFESLNLNAPEYGQPGATVLPTPSAGPIYQYSSDGLFRQNQLIVNFNIRAGTRLSLFGYYTLNDANSDVSGTGNFPMNSYNLSEDYGRASFDIRHRVFVGGTISLPRAFRLSPFMIVNSGSPYNVTSGPDLNNDSIFNDRPAFSNNPAYPSLTSVGHYNPNPTASEPLIPVNYLTGPSHFTLNLRLAKSFGFGPESGRNAQRDNGPGGGPPGGGGGGPRGGGGGGFGRGGGGFGGGPAATTRRYNMTFSVNARNVLNKVNAANPVGVLSSPDFGKSIAIAGGPFSSAAANRKIELQAMFSF